MASTSIGSNKRIRNKSGRVSADTRRFQNRQAKNKRGEIKVATITREEADEFAEFIRLMKIKFIKKYGWSVAKHWTDLEEV